MALPLESGLSTCLVACALAERLNLSLEQGQRIYHLALLRNVGCTAPTRTLAAVMGDEMVMREHSGLLDFADPKIHPRDAVARFYVRSAESAERPEPGGGGHRRRWPRARTTRTR